MNRRIKILYVDDEPNNLQSFIANFRQEFDILTASSGKHGLEILQCKEVQIIMSDQRMPDMTGVEFLAETLKLCNEPIRILMTDNSNASTIIDAINKAQIYYYLPKPWNEKHLRATIMAGNEIYDLRARNKELIGLVSEANEQMRKILYGLP